MGSGTLKSDARIISRAKKASRARSDMEFCSKLDGLLQEADESQLWLELLRDDCVIRDEELADLHSEADELLAIFTTIVAKVRRDSRHPEK